MVGYGRAEKPQVQEMVKLLLGLDAAPSPHDVADALAVAICHRRTQGGSRHRRAAIGRRHVNAAVRRGWPRAGASRHSPGTMIAPPARGAARETAQPVIVDVAGCRLRRAGAALDLLRVGEPGGRVTLRVHTHVREDVIALYGFAPTLEQELFERLIAISGIGPQAGAGVLSGIEPRDLIARSERRTSRG